MSQADWKTSRILVLGAKGMLGQDLMRVLREHLGVADCDQLSDWDLSEINICNKDEVALKIGKLKPSLVINAAAYTNVDGCEDHVEDAMDANAVAPGNIAKVCKEINARLVHFSTDFIFDGQSDRPYRPDDPTNPLSIYGKSKLEGENAIKTSGCDHLLIRTAWLFGVHGKNFVEAIFNKAAAGENLRVVNDQVGCPTYTIDLAHAVINLLNQDATETVHFCNSGICSWYDFAREIVGYASNDVTVEPIQSDQLDRPARRPAYSVLETSKYVELTGQTPASWQDALSRYMTEQDRSTSTDCAVRSTAETSGPS